MEQKQKYLMKLHWTWGGRMGCRFDEYIETTCYSEEEGLDYMRRRLIGVARSYGFDCGRLESPLNPCVITLNITPILETRSIDTKNLNDVLDEEVSQTERLIQSGNLYLKNGSINMESASSARIYPCEICGKMRSKDEGGNLVPILDFGKYRGKSIEDAEVTAHYLLWLYEQKWFKTFRPKVFNYIKKHKTDIEYQALAEDEDDEYLNDLYNDLHYDTD